MITINKKKFAANEKEFIASLFDAGGTCVGYYKVFKNQISLLNIQKEKIGAVTRHKVLAKATKQPETGKYWYSYGTINEIGCPDSFISLQNDIDTIVRQYLISHT